MDHARLAAAGFEEQLHLLLICCQGPPLEEYSTIAPVQLGVQVLSALKVLIKCHAAAVVTCRSRPRAARSRGAQQGAQQGRSLRM